MFCPDTIHNGTANHCPQHLSQHVEEGSENTYTTAGHQAQGDSRIQVCTANVTYALG